MRRTVQVVLTLVLFTAAMETLNYVVGGGLGEEFGRGFGCAIFLGGSLVILVVDRDYASPAVALLFFVTTALASVYLGVNLATMEGTTSLWIGVCCGAGFAFPLTFWAVGDERRQRGIPRRSISWRLTAPTEAEIRRDLS